MKKKKKAKKENSERWLLTYSDLITLLMILFILLFAMSNVNKDKYKDLAKSLNNAMGNGTSNSVIDGAPGVLPIDGSASPNKQVHTKTTKTAKASVTPSPTTTPSPDNKSNSKLNGKLPGYLKTKQDMKHMQAYFDNVLKKLKLSNYVTTDVRSDGLVTTFSNDVFFDSGTASLKNEMISGLNKLSPLLREIDNTILVEGYTDNRPMTKNSQFASNWQLSSTRASNVVQYLVDKCRIDGSQISAVGYGEYHPTTTNSTEQGRAKNRRIEIVILYN